MRVSVVMPVYNAMPYLPASVQSVLAQSFSDLQLIAVDDGSTDGSLDYLRSIEDPRLTILRSETRQGQGAARNLAMARCTGYYSAFADADDICLPERLACQVAYLDRHPGIGMLGTAFAYMGSRGRQGFRPPLALGHQAIRQDLLARRHAMVNATLMFRTEILLELGGFRVKGAGEDWDLFLRATEQTSVANLPEVLVHCRIHRGSSTVQQARTVSLRYAHACDNARKRAQSLPETTFEAFCVRQARAGFWAHWADDLDRIAFRHYRFAILDVLDGRMLTGYARLALAAALSPMRLMQRARRNARRLLTFRVGTGRGTVMLPRETQP
jgi:GT2 family glycosyltransferase